MEVVVVLINHHEYHYCVTIIKPLCLSLTCTLSCDLIIKDNCVINSKDKMSVLYHCNGNFYTTK